MPGTAPASGMSGTLAVDTNRDCTWTASANASWLVKSLDQRARTILKVSREIVRQQDGFFAYGVAHLRPLNLKTVATAIEMHERLRAMKSRTMLPPCGCGRGQGREAQWA